MASVNHGGRELKAANGFSGFRVVFRPRLQRQPPAVGPFEWSDIDIGAVIHATEGRSYEAEFRVGTNRFSYYPGTLLTLLNDVVLARDQVQTGADSLLTLQGYPVLLAQVSGEEVAFADPSHSSAVPFAYVPLTSVLEELNVAVNTVHSFVRKKCAVRLRDAQP